MKEEMVPTAPDAEPRGSHSPLTTDAEPSVPEGWRSLTELPDDEDAVQGLLADGTIVHAEWWPPVPEELWGKGGHDGSGWAFEAAGLPAFGRDAELIAWRPHE